MISKGDPRFESFLQALARMASGDLDHRVPLSPQRDELDAIAHGINALVGEIQLLHGELRRAMERAEAANVAKSFFLQNVSHEIRTPLTVILGTAELLASRRIPAGRVMDLHRRIQNNGRALIGILDDLHELAKIETDKLHFELRPVSLVDVVADVFESLAPQAEKKKLRLLTSHAEWAPVAMTDGKRARQILANLIGNAIKFTEHGHVAATFGAAKDGNVSIEVADTGIGMSQAELPDLFEPYVQASPTIAKRFGGSGLGLALSKRLAENLGGALHLVKSVPGHGTTFRLELPAAEGLRAPSEAWAPADAVEEELHGARILLVEDEDDVREVTSEILRLVGAAVTEARDGQEAIETTRKEVFDLVLTDVRMPRVDGLQATRVLRSEGVTCPIVALSAYPAADQERASMEAGCSGYLTKPLAIDQLLLILRRESRPRADNTSATTET